MIEFEAHLGEDIIDHYRKMARKAKETNKTYYFEANGIIFIANEDSDTELADKFISDCYTYEVKVLGPDTLRLNEDYKKEMDEINEKKCIEMEKKWEEKKKREEEDKKKVEELTANEPLMLVDENAYKEWYNKQSDSYGRRCFYYAEDLMKLLQIRYRENCCINQKDVDEIEHLIGYHGISGCQHSVVVSIMRNYWSLFHDGLFNYGISRYV